MVLEGRVDGDTGTQHWCGILGLEAVGNLESEVLVSTVIVGIAAIRLSPFREDRIVGAEATALAITFLADRAVRAFRLHTAASLGPDTNTVTNLVLRDVFADTDDRTHNLVADTAS